MQQVKQETIDGLETLASNYRSGKWDWIQKSFITRDENNGNAVTGCCLSQGLKLVFGRGIWAKHGTDARREICMTIRDPKIYRWNDNHERTYEDVLTAIDTTVDRLKERIASVVTYRLDFLNFHGHLQRLFVQGQTLTHVKSKVQTLFGRSGYMPFERWEHESDREDDEPATHSRTFWHEGNDYKTLATLTKTTD